MSVSSHGIGVKRKGWGRKGKGWEGNGIPEQSSQYRKEEVRRRFGIPAALK